MDPMKKARKTSRKKAPNGTPLTEERFYLLSDEKFKYFFEKIKELIFSSAKGTEMKLGKRIDAVEVRLGRTEMAITEHSRVIKGLDRRLTGVEQYLPAMEQRLSGKIDNTTKRLDDHEARIKKLERVA